MDYFNDVISRFSHGEISILNVLYENEAINRYNSVNKYDLAKETELSVANLRKYLTNLQRLLFVDALTGTKIHSFCITPYGLLAIEKLSEKVGVE